MKIRSASTAALSTVLLLTIGCKEQEVSRTSEGTLYIGAYESTDIVERVVSPGTRKLILEGHAGAINLRAGETDVARLSITRKARGNSPTEASENLAGLDIIEEGDELAFRYRFAAKKPELSRYVVSGEIPAGTPLTIQWTSGSISLDGFADDIDVRTVNGDVGFVGTSSKVRLQSRNGDVRGAVFSVPALPADSLRPIPAGNASFEFTTANGDVVATIPPSLDVHVDALTSAGEIRTANLPFVDEQFGTVNAGARFTARLGGGNGQLKLATQNGSVHIRQSIPRADRTSPAHTDVQAADEDADGAVETKSAERDSLDAGGTPTKDSEFKPEGPDDSPSSPPGARPADASTADTVKSSSS